MLNYGSRRCLIIDTSLLPYEAYIGIFKLLGVLIIITIFLEVLMRISVAHRVISIVNFTLNFLKITFYGMLIFFSFFYDFHQKTVIFKFPEYITLTQMILMPIAAFEIVSCINNFFDFK